MKIKVLTENQIEKVMESTNNLLANKDDQYEILSGHNRVNDVVSSVTTPVKALKGLKKVNLMPGEEKEATFNLVFKEVSLIDRNMNETVEPGAFKVMIGNLVGGF